MLEKAVEAVKIWAANLGLFTLIILTVWLPASIILEWASWTLLTENDLAQDAWRTLQLSALIQLIFGPLYVGALVYALSQIQQGLTVTYRGAIAHGFQTWSRLFVTRLVAGFFVFLGLVLFILPGIFLALRYALIDPVVALEKRSGQAARQRSAMLTQGKRGEILGTVIFTFIGISVSTTLLTVLITVPLTPVGLENNPLVNVFFDCLVNVIFEILTVVLFLFYWEARSPKLISAAPVEP